MSLDGRTHCLWGSLAQKKKKKKIESGKALGPSTNIWKPKFMELYHGDAISKIQNEGNSIGQKTWFH